MIDPDQATITNNPIPEGATITSIKRVAWCGRPCLVVRFVTAEGRLKTRMEWADELDSRPDSLTNYLRSTPTTERQHP